MFILSRINTFLCSTQHSTRLIIDIYPKITDRLINMNFPPFLLKLYIAINLIRYDFLKNIVIIVSFSLVSFANEAWPYPYFLLWVKSTVWLTNSFPCTWMSIDLLPTIYWAGRTAQTSRPIKQHYQHFCESQCQVRNASQ